MDPNQQEHIRNYADFLYRLSGNELAFLASAASLLMSQGLTSGQINSVGNFLEAVGQVMLCVGAQMQIRSSAAGYNSK